MSGYGGDNGAEGIIYIEAAASPTGSPIVILANEVSSTLSFFSVNNNVLDITLQEIKAINIGGKNLVEWISAKERQGDQFELERSREGSVFTTIASIPAKGTASMYRYRDEQPYEGVNYYRLKLNHVSGGYDYSPVVSATLKTKAGFLRAYPNPAQDQITVRIAGSVTATALLELMNTAGQVVKQLKPKNMLEIISVSDLPFGIYTLRYRDGSVTETVIITKQ